MRELSGVLEKSYILIGMWVHQAIHLGFVHVAISYNLVKSRLKQ